MTFNDDLLILVFDGATKRPSLQSCGLEWPPPERIEILGFTMVRTRMSAITDEQRAGMTHVCRAAEYIPEERAK